jgi:hypothetical protein
LQKKEKIDLLKKKRNGPERQTPATPAQICGLLGPQLAKLLRRHPIQIGWRAVRLLRASAHAGVGDAAG